MTGTFTRLTADELARLREHLHNEYKTIPCPVPVRHQGMASDLSYLLHEVSRAEQGRDPSRAVERHWAVA